MTEEGRPIDTCPKDGSEFLAYDPVSGKFDVCEWDKVLGVWSTQADGDLGPEDDWFWPERATLWWPLPNVTSE